jgi:hypothetical protein
MPMPYVPPHYFAAPASEVLPLHSLAATALRDHLAAGAALLSSRSRCRRIPVALSGAVFAALRRYSTPLDLGHGR